MATQSLRIMVVLPMYGGSLPIGQYCAQALAKLGHSVRVFEAQKLYPAFTGLKELDITPDRSNPLEHSFLRLVSQAAWTQAQEQQPHIVLAMAQAPLDKNTIMRMRQAGMRLVMWFVEDFRLFGYWRVFAPLYDAFAVIQKQPFLNALAEAGQSHAFYLPLAALPEFHRQLELTSAEKKEYGSDISFMGAGYPNRRLAFRPLAAKNFKIWGSDWDGEVLLSGNIQRQGQRISPEECVRIYNASKINLNLHSSVETDKLVSGGDFVNPRTFELASMGAFQLVDKRSLMDELFAPDELATFNSLDELYAKINHFLENPEEMASYAARAQQRVLNEHTYEKRMQTLVDYMTEAFGPWKNASEQAFSDMNLPETMREKLATLVTSLGLAEDCSFEDLVGAIRRRTGELDDLETAVLFLDEWAKQYKKR